MRGVRECALAAIQRQLRCEPTALRAVKVAIKTDDDGVVLFGRDVLVRIVEVESKPVHGFNQLRHRSWRYRDQFNTSVHQDVVNELEQYLRPCQPGEYHANGVQGEIGQRQLIGRKLHEKPAHLIGAGLIEESFKPDVGINDIYQSPRHSSALCCKSTDVYRSR